jgi:hypothetical protein
MRVSLVALLVASCGGAAAPAPAPTANAPTAAVSSPPPKDEACGDAYRPPAAPTGPKVDIPAVPEVRNAPKKIGDAFTVLGATHALRSPNESAEVTENEIVVVGWIVDSNVARAPKCAWHKTGIADPDKCATEIPAFVIADEKDTKPDDPDKPHIKVVGWARNFAAVFDATAQYKGLTAPPKQLYKDEMWLVDVPYPIPAAGTKVKVKGRYGFLFTRSSTGIVADPKNGVLTYGALEVVR